VNAYRPHVLVLPEDDADHAIAYGFQLSLDQRAGGQYKVLPSAGGWLKAIESFLTDHVAYMRAKQNAHFVLLIDFDNDGSRLVYVKGRIPPDVVNRVFVLGVLSNPEQLRASGAGNFEQIGYQLGSECQQRNSVLWNHQLLLHNAGEQNRLYQIVYPILFD
jgi:hypothetical protein